MYFLLLFFGLLAGVTTVLFGFGGGFVVVPVLYSVLIGMYGVDSQMGQAAMHIAVATSTCVMIFGAGLSTWRHHKAGTVPWGQVRPLLLFIAVGGNSWRGSSHGLERLLGSLGFRGVFRPDDSR